MAFEEVPPEDVVQYGIAKPRNGRTEDVFELADLIEKPSGKRGAQQSGRRRALRV